MFEWQTRINPALKLISGLLRDTSAESEIYVVHGSYGDIYWQLSVLKEIAQTGRKVVILVDKKYEDLAVRSGAYERIILADGQVINSCLNTVGLIGNERGLPIRLLPTLYPCIAELISAGDLDYTVFLRTLVRSDRKGYYEPLEATEWHVREAAKHLNEAEVPAGRTVLLSCDNNTHKEFPEEFWLGIIRVVTEMNLTPCLNSAGTIGNYGRPKLLSNVAGLKRISVPPSLAVSIVSACGYFIGGTNGFTGIQATFNKFAKGIHLINCTTQHGNNIFDKSGSELSVKHCYQSNFFKSQFLANLLELEVSTTQVGPELQAAITNHFMS